MASQLAEELLLAGHLTQMCDDSRAEGLDVALQEVRELVRAAAHPIFTVGPNGDIEYRLSPSEVSLARDLLKKLEVSGETRRQIGKETSCLSR